MLGPDGHVDLTGAWQGATAILVASGPSLSLRQVHRIGCARFADAVRVVAVSDAMYPCGWADLGYACDRRWWIHHRGMPRFRGMKVRMLASAADRKPAPELAGVLTVGLSGIDGYEPRGGVLRSGGHSGYQALNLAIQAGISRAILVGYDCGQITPGPSHFFGEHRDPIRSVSSRASWAPRYAALAEAARERGVEVINATPTSAIDAFPRRTLEDVL